MKKFLFVTILFLYHLVGCTEFQESNPLQDAITKTQTRALTDTIVFETLENPYSLERMRRLTGNPDLQPTHMYGRFLPADTRS